MPYFECISLLDYLLQKLFAGQRVQVSASVTDELLQVLSCVDAKLPEQPPVFQMRFVDVMQAIKEISSTQGLLFLSDSMRQALVSGITEMKTVLQLDAFDYYRTHDFDVTDETIPILRGIVKTALENDAI